MSFMENYDLKNLIQHLVSQDKIKSLTTLRPPSNKSYLSLFEDMNSWKFLLTLIEMKKAPYDDKRYWIEWKMWEQIFLVYLATVQISHSRIFVKSALPFNRLLMAPSIITQIIIPSKLILLRMFQVLKAYSWPTQHRAAFCRYKPVHYRKSST